MCIGTLSQQPTWQGVEQPTLAPQPKLHFGLQNAKKWARLLVQHEPHAGFVAQLAVQLLQVELQLIDLQPRLQGSKQSSERRPRCSRSSKQGLGQQRPTVGGGTGVQQVGTASWQPQSLFLKWWWKPTGLITDRVGCCCAS